MDLQNQATNIQPQVKLSLPPELTEIRSFYQWETFAIQTDADLEAVAMARKEIANRIKVVEAKRKEVTGPIKQGIRAFELMCNSVTDPLEEIARILKSKTDSFLDARRARIEAEAKAKRDAELAEQKAKADEALKTAVTTGSTVAMEEAAQRQKNVERIESNTERASQTLRTSGVTMADRLVWRWKVTDLDKVPRNYFILDEKTLNSLAKGYKANPVAIEGIIFYQESDSSIR